MVYYLFIEVKLNATKNYLLKYLMHAKIHRTSLIGKYFKFKQYNCKWNIKLTTITIIPFVM